MPREETPRSRRLDALDRPAPVSRLADIEAKGGAPLLPTIEAGGYLLAWFWEIGPVEQGGMAAAPLSHQELESWQRNTGIALLPWEARLLRHLSQAYVNESRKAEQPDCPAPYGAPELEFDRDLVARKIAGALDALAAPAAPGTRTRKRKARA